MLIVGGEDHKTGQKDDAPERFARLEAWTRERFPMIQSVDSTGRGRGWSPWITWASSATTRAAMGGTSTSRQATRAGMTHGPIAASYHRPDHRQGEQRESLYDPSRVSLKRGWSSRRDLNVAAQYRDYVNPASLTPDEIPPHRRGHSTRRHKVAVYRDESARPRAVSVLYESLLHRGTGTPRRGKPGTVPSRLSIRPARKVGTAPQSRRCQRSRTRRRRP